MSEGRGNARVAKRTCGRRMEVRYFIDAGAIRSRPIIIRIARPSNRGPRRLRPRHDLSRDPFHPRALPPKVTSPTCTLRLFPSLPPPPPPPPATAPLAIRHYRCEHVRVVVCVYVQEHLRLLPLSWCKSIVVFHTRVYACVCVCVCVSCI